MQFTKGVLLVLVSLTGCICGHQVRGKGESENYNRIPFPHLMYMAPREPGVVVLNERSSFTQELNTGWILKENEPVDFLFYLFVEEKIVDLNEVHASYVYFTLNKNVCNESNLQVYDPTKKYSEKANYIFKLNFLPERSKIYQRNNNHTRRNNNRSKGLHKVIPRDVSWQNNATDNSMFYTNNTMLVGHAVIRLKHGSPKYFTCVHFSTKRNYKNETSLDFVHQGGRNIWLNVITTKDLLPIWAVVIFYFILMMFSALCSGLNLGKNGCFSLLLHFFWLT